MSLSVVRLFTLKFFFNSPEILGVSIVLCHGVDLLEAVAADGEVRNLEAWYEEELNIHFKMYQITRSAMKEREKYIENKTGASHLRESEFCCFYASEGTRTKEGEPQILCYILFITLRFNLNQIFKFEPDTHHNLRNDFTDPQVCCAPQPLPAELHLGGSVLQFVVV